jgi:hypothetical protein
MRRKVHDSDPTKCPSCGRATQHVGWKKRGGTTIRDWDHYECAYHECGACKLWWVDRLSGEPLTPMAIPGMNGKKRR